MTREAAATADVTGRGAAMLLLVATIVIAAAVGWGTYQRFWMRVPVMQATHTDGDRFDDELRAIIRNSTGNAREAFAARLAGSAIRASLTGVISRQELQRNVADAVSAMSSTQLGRLQLAAVRIELLEAAGEPLANWWPKLRPYLSGLDNADFSHHQLALVGEWSAAYEAVGFGPGTAVSFAEEAVGHNHGAFLQYFTDRVLKLIEDRSQAGDAEVARFCRQVLGNLLKQWTLEDGPIGLRLLAADLLCRATEAPAFVAAHDGSLAFSSDLRKWRESYREAARSRPASPLDPLKRPILAADANRRYVRLVGLSTWLAAAAVPAALLTLLMGWTWPKTGCGQFTIRSVTAGAVICAMLLLLVGLAWVIGWPESVAADFQIDWSSAWSWPRHPFIAVGIAALVILAVGWAKKTQERGIVNRAAPFAATATTTLLALSIMLGAVAVAGSAARDHYERQVRAANEDVVSALCGVDADQRLAGLREWTP